jgi:hypothetical protein
VIGYAFSSGLLFVPSLVPAFRLIGLPLRDVGARLLPIGAAALGMAGVVLAQNRIMTAAPVLVLPWVSPPAVRLVTGIVFGALLYMALLEAFGQAPRARAAMLWQALRSR